MLQTSLLFMKSLNKTKTPIFYLFCVFLFPNASFFTFHYENILFKYIENSTTKKKEKFRQKILIFFIFLLKT